MTDSLDPAPPIRILLADDHPIVRDGLVAVLGTQPDFVVVGEAADGVAMVDMVRQLRPDVVLADLSMPQIDGAEAIRRIRAEQIPAAIIVLTAFDSDERIFSAIAAGASGYLLKGVPRAEIFHAIRVVAAGGALLQPVVATRLLRQIEQQGEPPAALTEREREVLCRIGLGHPNKEIAAALGITERTVKFHVSSLFAKLGATNRTEAVAFARQRGLI
ncbi:response regulator transcription factor [Chloroflexia bacterium SDU3-3]|nr:response regulator transcription factor [Chloroflexia bacterium SDU3-3]